jgi:hypothetical protein
MITLLILINSTAERNLNKVGEAYSWLTLKPVAMSKYDFDRGISRSIGKFLVIAIWQGLFIFLSWLNIFLFAVLTIYKMSQDYGAPKEVKEFRWKLKNQDMTFDELILEIIKVKGLNKEDFEQLRSEMIEFVKERREFS